MGFAAKRAEYEAAVAKVKPMIERGLVPPPEPLAEPRPMSEAMQEAVLVWNAMGGKLDWSALGVACVIAGVEAGDGLMERLLMIHHAPRG